MMSSTLSAISLIVVWFSSIPCSRQNPLGMQKIRQRLTRRALTAAAAAPIGA
jgi:hypothetical protein